MNIFWQMLQNINMPVKNIFAFQRDGFSDVASVNKDHTSQTKISFYNIY